MTCNVVEAMEYADLRYGETGVGGKKNTPPHKNTGEEIILEDSESVAGLQILP